MAYCAKVRRKRKAGKSTLQLRFNLLAVAVAVLGFLFADSLSILLAVPYPPDDAEFVQIERRLQAKTAAPPPLTPQQQFEKFIEDRKKVMAYDDEYGFMPYAPYAGGSKYRVETRTDKPGFKVWVDGGVTTYSLDVCYAKSLNCSATCCLQSYCAPTRSMCTNY